MELYSNSENYKLYEGDMRDMLEVIEPNSIDAILTDPPYELNFMNCKWDNSGIAFQKETWKKCYDVLKSGGHMLVFGGSRTFHRIACAIEDAGFEIRDTIMWIYGCLSEDTEILTNNGFKHFHEITNDDIIRIYDIENGIYKWEKPERWNVYSVNKDTCYRIKSDSTDQLVSRNHRCLIEREGKLVFEFAENLNGMERMPVLSYNIPYIQESERNILFTDLLWQDERLVKELFSQWKGKEKSEEISLRRNKSVLERWNNLSQKKRELYKSEYQICEMSERIYNDGEKRWICDGTSVVGSTSNSSTLIKNRGCSSYKSQCRGQQVGEFDAICDKSRPQELREWKTYQTTLATITKEEYSGIIYCPTVSTGCFVARRNGKVFITGNSGFPKSMNIGLAIDKKNGVESPIIGQNEQILKKQAKDLREGKRKIVDSFNSGASERNNGFKTVSADIKQAQNEYAGWGTQLKPSYEAIIVCRKPCEGSIVDNVMKYGVGGINIDECRVPISKDDIDMINAKSSKNPTDNYNRNESKKYGDYALNIATSANEQGRFPANTILTYDDSDYNEVCDGFPNTKSSGGSGDSSQGFGGHIYGKYNHDKPISHLGGLGDEGSASRYFYCAKASKRDRDEGLEEFDYSAPPIVDYRPWLKKEFEDGNNDKHNDFMRLKPKKNTHPTVKPTSLMQYLVRLVTPKGGTVLDPFNGSGSTGKACMYENADRNANYKYVGIELTEEYLPIAKARIEFAEKNPIMNYEIKKTKTETNKTDDDKSESIFDM